jgi:transposase-like protein
VRNLTRSEKLRIRKLYLSDDYTVGEIASKFGCKETLLRCWISNQGLPAELQKIKKIEKEQVSTEVNKATEYKTQRQLDYYSNLQEKTEELTEKALANAADAEGIAELNTALGSVKSAVSLFEDASAKLGESLQTAGSVAESGNQYNFFYMDDKTGRELLEKCKNSVQRMSPKGSDSSEVIDIE